MTLQQIAQIKKEFRFLKLDTYLTGMFDNEHWAAVFNYDIIHSRQMIQLCNHLQKERLNFFFCSVGVSIQ